MSVKKLNKMAELLDDIYIEYRDHVKEHGVPDTLCEDGQLNKVWISVRLLKRIQNFKRFYK